MAVTDPRAELIAGLRELIDFYQRRPDFPVPHQVRCSVYVDDVDQFRAVTRALGGHRQKEASESFFTVERHLSENVAILVNGYRDQVCTRRQVGTVTELQPAPDAPMVEVEVPVYTWECADSILNDHEATQ